jgi:hypothetical protein
MRIFISYRREDSADSAALIYNELKLKYGEDKIFFDVKNRKIGRWEERLKKELVNTDAVVVVIGQDWLGLREDGTRRIDGENDRVRFEVATALKRCPDAVIPVLVHGARLPEMLPEELSELVGYEYFDLRRDHLANDLSPVLELLSLIDPDAQQTDTQQAAVMVGEETKWLTPMPTSSVLAAHDLDATETPPPGSSIALSADAAVTAQQVDTVLTVYVLSDPRLGVYELWRSALLDSSWSDPKVIAVRRRGVRSVQVALSCNRNSSNEGKIVCLDIDHAGKIRPYIEIDGHAASGAFIGSSLVYVDPVAHQIWKWKQSEGTSDLWLADLGIRARWVDCAMDDGNTLVAILGESHSDTPSDAFVVLIRGELEGTQESYGTKGRPSQLSIPRKLCRRASRRVLVKGERWTDVLGEGPDDRFEAS